ncbi:MAG: gliding motility-associated ABC transporter ATP-binding subunit GldA [Bacteroidota bacterium]
MVSVQGLTKIYGTQRAVDQLSFELQAGEVLGFLGPNGAGKSTTMKIISCFIEADEGSVQVDGYDVSESPLEVRKRVGYLPEHNPLYLDMYVHEFLEFVARIYQLSKQDRKNRISEVIDMTGLGKEQHKKIGMLSKGYRQRVGLCQALIHDPQVLILDEPTNGLDPNQIVEIRELIREVGKDKTVIFSSHILSEVESIANRILIINQGKIVADAATDQIRLSAESEQQTDIELETSGFDLTGIEAWESVKSIERLSDTQFRIISGVEEDLRKALFEEVVKQQHTLLGMSRQTYSLEDAFRKLTGTV